MTGDRTARLLALRAEGMLDDGELEQELARLHSPPPRARRVTATPLIVGLSLILLGTAASGAFLISRRERTTSLDLANDQAALPIHNVSASSISKAPDPIMVPPTGRIVARVSEPPTDYLDLCIYAQLSPLGSRVRTMAHFLVEQGRTITWEQDGADWILRSRWLDRLTRQIHEESYAFKRDAGALPAAACNGRLDGTMLWRIARDGIPVRSLDPALAPMLHQDHALSENALPEKEPEPANGALDAPT